MLAFWICLWPMGWKFSWPLTLSPRICSNFMRKWAELLNLFRSSPTSALLASGLGKSLLWGCDVCVVGGLGAFLHALDVSSLCLSYDDQNVSRHCKHPLRSQSTWAENHWFMIDKEWLFVTVRKWTSSWRLLTVGQVRHKAKCTEETFFKENI